MRERYVVPPSGGVTAGEIKRRSEAGPPLALSREFRIDRLKWGLQTSPGGRGDRGVAPFGETEGAGEVCSPAFRRRYSGRDQAPE